MMAVVVVLLLIVYLGRRFRIADGEMKYVGWILARPEDIEVLEKLVVSGAMIYNKREGAIEYCEVPDKKTLRKLEKEFPGFWSGSFSAVRI